MKLLNLFALGLMAFLLAVPQAARALEFNGTVADQTFTVGTAVNITLPPSKHQDNPFCPVSSSSYTLTPAPPQGLSFSGGRYILISRTLSGTPSTPTAQTEYTYTAHNDSCYQSTSIKFNITVAAQSGCSSQSGTDLQADCAVLETLYDSAGGANWSNNTNWKSANALHKWHGVTVSDNGRVSAIKLYENALTGTIPDLSSLAGLTELDLGHNSLSGSISTASLGSLSSLSTLRLDSNSLSGTIPDLSGTEVRTLFLDDNELSGTIPAWLNTQDLRELSLHDNQLSGTIPDLSDVGGYDLDLSNNNLSGTIPAATHFPEGMRELQPRIRYPSRPSGILNLSNNNLSGAIPDLSSLNNLYILDLSNNGLNGSITAALFSVELDTLDLSNNLLVGSIPDLTSLTKLAILDLQNNRFSGTIPDLSSTRIRKVFLNGNRISGTINADNFRNSVSFLYLHDNQLSNSTPIDLSSLSSLFEISLWGNPGLDVTNITGVNLKFLEKAALWILYDGTGGSGWTSSSGWPVGHDFGLWHGVTTDGSGNVTGIDLSDNNLSGAISTSLSALDSLTTLDLSDNASLGGTFPVEFKNNTGMTSVDIRCTAITVPTADTAFTMWKTNLGSEFKTGCTVGGSSQGSSPPVSPPPGESPVEGSGSGQEAGEPEDVRSPDPAVDSGDIEAGGGCALVSGGDGERSGAAASGLLLAAFVLLPAFTGRHGRRAEER